MNALRILWRRSTNEMHAAGFLPCCLALLGLEILALATADSLEPFHANLHIFVASAPWLSEEDAKWVLEELLGMPSCHGNALIGDDGPYLYPGVAQLVPLLNRLGGAATLLETARVVAKPVPLDRD